MVESKKMSGLFLPLLEVEETEVEGHYDVKFVYKCRDDRVHIHSVSKNLSEEEVQILKDEQEHAIQIAEKKNAVVHQGVCPLIDENLAHDDRIMVINDEET